MLIETQRHQNDQDPDMNTTTTAAIDMSCLAAAQDQERELIMPENATRNTDLESMSVTGLGPGLEKDMGTENQITTTTVTAGSIPAAADPHMKRNITLECPDQG